MELFPEATRGPGTFVSAEFPLPLDTSAVDVLLTGRDTWGDVGAGQAVMTLTLEVNTTGTWRHVAGSAMAPGTRLDEAGVLSADAHLAVLLSSDTVPEPSCRVTLTCVAPCLCACSVTFA